MRTIHRKSALAQDSYSKGLRIYGIGIDATRFKGFIPTRFVSGHDFSRGDEALYRMDSRDRVRTNFRQLQ